jgi:glycosyltransferase involved in cell wall biosynthesis
MKSKKCGISVVCPVYNSSNYIDQTVKSILQQTIPPEEIIFCDDGSLDNSFQKICKYRKDFKEKKINFKLIKSHHYGPGYARNLCIKNINYNFVAFIDSDDIWLPNKISLIKNAIQKNPVNNFFIHWEIFLKLDGKKLILKHAKNYSPQDSLIKILYSKNIFSTSAVVCKYSLIKNHLFDVKLQNAQDYDFWLKICGKIKLKVIPKVLGYYVERKNNITNKYYFFRLFSLLKILFRYKDKVDINIFFLKFIRIIFTAQWFKFIK